MSNSASQIASSKANAPEDRFSIGPWPRLNLYTSASQYLTAFWELLSGKWRRGNAVNTLEAEFKASLASPHSVCTPTARVGIHLALKAITRPGQKVIMSPYTIADIVNMVICAGAVPVFCDTVADGYNIDATKVEALIEDDTAAVLATHFYGQACEIEQISTICRAQEIALVEDCAQALGARVNGRHLGTFGDVGVFSFGMFKNVNSFLGGMVVTSDPQIEADIREQISRFPLESRGRLVAVVIKAMITDLVTHPILFRTFFFRFFRFAFLRGIDAINNQLKIDVDPQCRTDLPEDYAKRMTPLQARLVSRGLESVAKHTQERIALAKIYHDGLADIPALTLPPFRDDGSCIYWYFPLIYPEREKLVSHALRAGRDITPSYHRNCADLPCFAEYQRDCPNARAAESSVIYLPTYPWYPQDEALRTVRAIREYFDQGR